MTPHQRGLQTSVLRSQEEAGSYLLVWGKAAKLGKDILEKWKHWKTNLTSCQKRLMSWKRRKKAQNKKAGYSPQSHTKKILQGSNLRNPLIKRSQLFHHAVTEELKITMYKQHQGHIPLICWGHGFHRRRALELSVTWCLNFINCLEKSKLIMCKVF